MVLYIDGNYPLHSLHRELVNGLADLGNEMIVYVPMKGNELEGKYNSDHPGVKVVYSNILNNIDRIAFIPKIYKLVSDVEKKIDMSKIDCILAGTVYSDGGVAYLLHKKYNIPFSVAVRETDVTYHMKWRPYLNSFVKGILKEATNVIFISPSYKKYFEKFACDEKKYVTIPNGVNDYWFIGNDRERRIHDPVSLIFVGEISKRKNVTTIIYVISELKKSGLYALLHVVGSGNEEQKCKDLASKLGVSDNIAFHGWQNSKEGIKEFYDQADIFVMPSLRETFGTVYIEAISQGLPVIYTKNQGIDGYFKQGTVGFACDPRNAYDIKDAVIKTIQNYKSISATCSLMSKNFMWKVVSAQYNTIIESMRNR